MGIDLQVPPSCASSDDLDTNERNECCNTKSHTPSTPSDGSVSEGGDQLYISLGRAYGFGATLNCVYFAIADDRHGTSFVRQILEALECPLGHTDEVVRQTILYGEPSNIT